MTDSPLPEAVADMTSTKARELFTNLVTLCPDFPSYWAEEAYLWTDEAGKVTPCRVFSGFSHYIAEVLAAKQLIGLQPTFEYVEQAMSDIYLRDAAATCFLENLINRTPKKIDPATFVPLLGPHSREYCRAWDEFGGMQTEGLW